MMPATTGRIHIWDKDTVEGGSAAGGCELLGLESADCWRASSCS